MMPDIYEYKNPENPANTKLAKHLHLWNVKDGVAGGLGGLIGSDYYNANTVTENVEIIVGKEYDDNVIPLIYGFPELINAHGFDANRPQLIYQMLLNGSLTKLDNEGL